MYRHRFNDRQALRFKHFSRRSYALFSCIGREVLICTLSVATLTYAKADGISTKPAAAAMAADSLGRQEVKLDEVRGGFGVQTDISINGGTFDQITILLNGVNMSSPQTGHNAADFPVSLSDIERIEVLEGASARVFGSSAFNGAINIVTRTDKESSVRVSAEGGSFGTFGGDAGLSLRTGNVSQQLSGGYTQSDGGTANSDFKRRRMYYMGALESRYVNLSWQGGLSSQDYGASTFYSARFNNQWEATRRFMASALADVRPFADERLVFSPSVYWHRDVDHYQLTRGKEGAQNGENYHRMDVYGAALNAHASWLLGKTAVGVDLRKEHILSTAYGTLLDESEWTAIHGSDRHYDHRGDRTNTSVFLEHNVILGGFTLSAGVLANRNTGLDNRFRFYPGVDISYRPSDNWKFYASWNKALRVPTFTDLYTSNSAQQGDPNLSPERNSTFKIGTRFRTRGVEAVLSGFYSEGKNIIDWVYPTAESRKYQAMNIGKLDNMGYSADVTLNMDELIPGSFITRIKAGYAFIHQKHETDREIFGSLYALEYLRHKATFQLDHRIWSRLSASWAVRWQERMNNYSPYTKVDVKLMWTAPSYSLYVKADNLTCHRYYDLGAVRQPGLWIMAGGSVRIGL